MVHSCAAGAPDELICKVLFLFCKPPPFPDVPTRRNASVSIPASLYPCIPPTPPVGPALPAAALQPTRPQLGKRNSGEMLRSVQLQFAVWIKQDPATQAAPSRCSVRRRRSLAQIGSSEVARSPLCLAVSWGGAERHQVSLRCCKNVWYGEFLPWAHRLLCHRVLPRG